MSGPTDIVYSHTGCKVGNTYALGEIFNLLKILTFGYYITKWRNYCLFKVWIASDEPFKRCI